MNEILIVIMFFGVPCARTQGEISDNAVVGAQRPVRQTVEEYELARAFSEQKRSFDDLLTLAQKSRTKTNDKNAQIAIDNFIRTLERMSKDKDQMAKEKDEVKKLIRNLRSERDFRWLTTDDPNSPAGKILKLGNRVVPLLIEELENDDFTRSICPDVTSKVERPYIHVQRVGDCAAGLLWRLTGKSYGDSWNIHDPRATLSPSEVKRQYKTWSDNERKTK
jgi:hypothetical protein